MRGGLLKRALSTDAPALADIYNRAIEQRIVAFETEPRTEGGLSPSHSGTPGSGTSTPAAESVSPLVSPQEGTFWVPDHPVQRPTAAFGKIPMVRSARVLLNDEDIASFTINHFTWATQLPKVSDSLPVFMTEVYSAEHRRMLKGKWNYVPEYALVSSGSMATTLPQGPDLATQAAAFLKEFDLLMPDSEPARVGPTADGSVSVVAFYRHIGGIPVYGDKPACVFTDRQGQVTSFMIRRRPLLEVSEYPTRSPAMAWQDLVAGRYTSPSTYFCQDTGRMLHGNIDEFRVTAVEIAYWEHHVDVARQPMMPYYVFRNSAGVGLYVPAISPDWVEMPRS